MKRMTAYFALALLILAVGAAAVSSFYFLTKTPALSVSAAANPLNPTTAAALIDQSDWLKIARSPNEPVRVAETRFDDAGKIIIQVENISSQPIIFIGYILAPADCPKSNHPAAFYLRYGDQSGLRGNGEHEIDPPVDPSGRATLTISQKTYKGILNAQKSAKCASAAKPKLNLMRVVFADRSGWEGFADGVDHSEWNGRFVTAEPDK